MATESHGQALRWATYVTTSSAMADETTVQPPQFGQANDRRGGVDPAVHGTFSTSNSKAT